MLIRPGITFIAFLSSLASLAQISFVSQDGISGDIRASYVDQRGTLYCVTQNIQSSEKMYFYSFDLNSNRIIEKRELQSTYSEISFNPSDSAFVLYGRRDKEKGNPYISISGREGFTQYLPPAGNDLVPGVQKISTSTTSYLTVTDPRTRKSKNYYAGIGQAHWETYFVDEKYLYAISTQDYLYVFDHKKQQLEFAIPLNDSYRSILLSSDKKYLVLESQSGKALVDLATRKLSRLSGSFRIKVGRINYSNSTSKLDYSSGTHTGSLKFDIEGYSNTVKTKAILETELSGVSARLEKKWLIIEKEGISNFKKKIKIHKTWDLIEGESSLELMRGPGERFYLLQLHSGKYDQLFCLINKGDALDVLHINPCRKNSYFIMGLKPDQFSQVFAPVINSEYSFIWNNEEFFILNGKLYRQPRPFKDGKNFTGPLKNRSDEALRSIFKKYDRKLLPLNNINHTEQWATAQDDKTLLLIDYEDSVLFELRNIDPSALQDLSYNRARKRAFFIKGDGFIWVYDLEKQKLIGNILLDAAGGVIFQSESGKIFSGSKEIRSISVNKKGIGDFHDYISYLNEPEVLKEFGLFTDSYYMLHLNAKKRLGNKDMGSINNSILEPPAVSYSLGNDSVVFNIRSQGETRIVINGKEEFRKDAAENLSLSLKLNQGSNKIKIYNYKNGIPGIPFSLNLESSNPAKRKSEIFFAGMGINNYQSSAFSPLRYAVKDIDDMSALFSNRGDAVTFRNQFARRDSFMRLKSKLQQLSEDDIAIIHLSGHGILDKNGKFYFCTYDMDTSNPAKNGISVDDISAVFEGCKSRKRLVIIDACHSGFIDRSLFTTDTTATDTVILAQKGASSEKLNTANIDKDPAFKAFKLMLEAYPTFELYTGINMMAAAAGYEYALEMAEWQNGALTYSIKEALIKKAADRNSDKDISIEELKDYIIKRVPVLTNGSQSPDFRLENLEYDWMLW